MAWTLQTLVDSINISHAAEMWILAEFGDIESHSGNPEQRGVVLWIYEPSQGNMHHSTIQSWKRHRAILAWNYSQEWADVAGRPIRLKLIYPTLAQPRRQGIKTFRPLVSGGHKTSDPHTLPRYSALSELPAFDYALYRGVWSNLDCCGDFCMPFGNSYEKGRAQDLLELHISRFGYDVLVERELKSLEIRDKKEGRRS